MKSFAWVGKDKTADELIKIKDKVVKYLRQILENIETYLTKQEYLDSSTGTP
ncbi:MAG: MAE_28990/MAE_18760 family HEPN-like nuclease [Microcoleaceae cyanobacterium]